MAGHARQEGGGVLTNQAIHTLDLMRYFGGEIAAISGQITNQHLRGVIEVEDTACVLLQYASGAAGIFYATTAYRQNAPVLLELVCEQETLRSKGRIFIGLRGIALRCCAAKRSVCPANPTGAPATRG